MRVYLQQTPQYLSSLSLKLNLAVSSSSLWRLHKKTTTSPHVGTKPSEYSPLPVLWQMLQIACIIGALQESGVPHAHNIQSVLLRLIQANNNIGALRALWSVTLLWITHRCVRRFTFFFFTFDIAYFTWLVYTHPQIKWILINPVNSIWENRWLWVVCIFFL